MKNFFDDDVLLNGKTAVKLYEKIKDLPIIDYHCHLNEKDIAENKPLADVGELWLSGDHYKWRAMRMCGVEEKYITGDASYKEKFSAYASIMPKLMGNPLYYWTQLELKEIFGINQPLDKDSAEDIYALANSHIRGAGVRDLLSKLRVEFIATTDDPISPLSYHGKYGGITVTPTFRPDKIFTDGGYIEKIKAATGESDLKKALEKRLDYFVSKGCKIADCGLDFLPEQNSAKTDMLMFLAKLYAERGIIMQLHFGACRNVNSRMYALLGADAGFDIFHSEANTDNLVEFLNKLDLENSLPTTILYSLNENAAKSVCTLSGAFPNVYAGAAWWFNDTLEGIRRQLVNVAEYGVLGVFPGMLTDSRSFCSYVRFDFFRRILASFVAEKTDSGEYDVNAADMIMKDVCHDNIRRLLKI